MSYEEEIIELNNIIRKRNKTIFIIVLTIMVIVVTLLICYKAYMFLPFTIFFILLVSIIITVTINQSDYIKIHNLFRDNSVKKVLNDNFQDASLYDYGMNEKTVLETGMVSTRDRFRSNDLLIAKYKGVPFKMSDIKIQVEDTDDEGHTTYHTVFLGQYVIFDYKKNFKTNIEIISNNFTIAKKGKDFTSVKFEDVKFNKMFSTYALKEIDAFYLLTPTFMEKVMNLGEKYKSIMIFFINNQMHLLINSHKDLFNLYATKNIDFEVERNRIVEEINFIKDIIDSLELGGK